MLSFWNFPLRIKRLQILKYRIHILENITGRGFIEVFSCNIALKLDVFLQTVTFI